MRDLLSSQGGANKKIGGKMDGLDYAIKEMKKLPCETLRQVAVDKDQLEGVFDAPQPEPEPQQTGFDNGDISY